MPELHIGDDRADISRTSIYNSAALIGEVWNLGGGWSASEFVGAFIPVNTYNGETLGIGGNFLTFTNLAGVAYNGADGSLNSIYCSSTDACIALGWTDGTQQAFVSTWDGTNWSSTAP